MRHDFVSPLQPTPVSVGKTDSGAADEIVLTVDPLVNFAQLAVRTCQRSQGDKNKAMREAWIRLCGTYQSKGGPLAAKEVRKVRFCLQCTENVSIGPIMHLNHRLFSLSVPCRFLVHLPFRRMHLIGC